MALPFLVRSRLTIHVSISSRQRVPAFAHLARVHDVLRINRLLQLAHERDCTCSGFFRQVLLLAHSNAVLARARPVHRDGEMYHTVDEALDDLVLGVVPEEEHAVEVTVANVALDRAHDVGRGNIRLRLAHEIW
jgi:hypothetical protein